jgi:hypothetical protein
MLASAGFEPAVEGLAARSLEFAEFGGVAVTVPVKRG